MGPRQPRLSSQATPPRAARTSLRFRRLAVTLSRLRLQPPRRTRPISHQARWPRLRRRQRCRPGIVNCGPCGAVQQYDRHTAFRRRRLCHRRVWNGGVVFYSGLQLGNEHIPKKCADLEYLSNLQRSLRRRDYPAKAEAERERGFYCDLAVECPCRNASALGCGQQHHDLQLRVRRRRHKVLPDERHGRPVVTNKMKIAVLAGALLAASLLSAQTLSVPSGGIQM